MLTLPHEPLQRRGTIVEHGPTVYCDLRQSQSELLYGTRETVRRQIRRVQNEGYVAKEDLTWNHYDDFQEVYAATMRRVGASDWYFFDQDHFAQLKEALADTMHLLVVQSGSQIVCAGLFSELCGIVHYHLAGTRDGYERCDVSKLLIHYAREWAQERGNDVLHLGGGVGAANDSLLHFKSGFSKLRSTFHTWRLIVDERAYRELVAQSRPVGNSRGRVHQLLPRISRGSPKTHSERGAARDLRAQGITTGDHGVVARIPKRTKVSIEQRLPKQL